MLNNPKIVHLITRMDMGGSAQNTLMTCLELADRYDTVLAFGPSLESQMTPEEQHAVSRRIDRFKSVGGRVVVLPELVRRIDPVRDILTFVRLLRWLRQEHPDIVHTHTSKAGLLGRWAAWLAGVPIIVHTPHGHVFYGHFGPVMSNFFLHVEQVSESVTDHLVCLTQGELIDHVNRNVIHPEKASVIHSGVDLRLFKAPTATRTLTRRRLGIADRAVVVGSIGWLLPIKAPEVLLEAMGSVWKRRPDIELVFVGKGDLERSLKAAVKRMNAADRVRFLGWRSDIPDLMHCFDLFVLPSRNEGMGRVIIEAMAAGLPVVASRTGGVPDLVTDGQNGFLVPPGDAAALGRAILTLADRPDLRRRMGEAGMRRAEKFSLQRMVYKLDALYARLLA